MEYLSNTKKRIFYTAIDMFSSLGYSESTMRELANRVGVRPASLYNHYKSKDELLNDIFDYFLVNDKKYRNSVESIVESAKDKNPSEILAMMYVTYIDDEDFYIMNKILHIAVGYQFENKKAKEVFNYIYYDMCLHFREKVFSELIKREILEPFDYKTIAFLMTSFSMMQFMMLMNNSFDVPEYTHIFNTGANSTIELLSKYIHKKN